jgi:hypothetical protein
MYWGGGLGASMHLTCSLLVGTHAVSARVMAGWTSALRTIQSSFGRGVVTAVRRHPSTPPSWSVPISQYLEPHPFKRTVSVLLAT